jgi:hypothetical protein
MVAVVVPTLERDEHVARRDGTAVFTDSCYRYLIRTFDTGALALYDLPKGCPGQSAAPRSSVSSTDYPLGDDVRTQARI